MIRAFYNRQGYLVESDGAEIYSAGNSARDSQEWLTPGDPDALSLRTLRSYAIQTGKEFAEERVEKFGGVERIDEE